ncbi:hypothetical protein PANO111632_13240 [Paracoccus nototheniae]|uniref:Uncharacterized protein n=1 Tax=Paracoccus nototheniae TaxID=2489002 RepID=A0ABW4DSM8_9RHOB|nr:hypothetical protein [Paracoccus nototheniae]
MTSNLSTIEAQLKLLSWRDTQLQSITAQFEAAWPGLELAIKDHVASMSLWGVGRAHYDIRPIAGEIIVPWAEEQGRIAAARAEEGLAEILASAPHGALSDYASTALPAIAGVGLLAASVLAVPAVVSYATVASVSFVVFTTTTVSTPILLVGGAAIAALSMTGTKALGHATDRIRSHLEDRLTRHARTVVFGDGLAPSARCLLNDTQAIVLRAGQTSLETV